MPTPVVIPSADRYAAIPGGRRCAGRSRWPGTHDPHSPGDGGSRHRRRAGPARDLFDELVDLVEAPQLIEGAIDAAYLCPATGGAQHGDALAPALRAAAGRRCLRRSPGADGRGGAACPGSCASPTVVPTPLPPSDAATSGCCGPGWLTRPSFWRPTDASPAPSGVKALDRVTFAEGLGTLADRSRRIAWLTDQLCRQPGDRGGHRGGLPTGCPPLQARSGEPDGGGIPRVAGRDGSQVPPRQRGNPATWPWRCWSTTSPAEPATRCRHPPPGPCSPWPSGWNCC